MKSRGRAGYSLVEVLAAALLLGLIAVGVGRFMGTTMRMGNLERTKADAERIAATELEALRAAGPTLLTLPDTFRVDATDRRAADGPFLVELTRETTCNGGTDPKDNNEATPIIVSDCTDERATLTYGVRVRYRDHTTGASNAVEVTRSLTLGSWGRHAHTLLDP